MEQSEEVAIVRTIQASLSNLSDEHVCGMRHEYEYNGVQCSQSISDSTIGCPHAERDVLEHATRGLFRIGALSREKFEKLLRMTQHVFEGLGRLDDRAAGTEGGFEVEQLVSDQEVLIRYRRRLKQKILNICHDCLSNSSPRSPTLSERI